MKRHLSFETLAYHYQYDQDLPLAASLHETRKTDGGILYELTFRSTDGLTVHGHAAVPNLPGPWPLMIAPPRMAGRDLTRCGVLTAHISYRLIGPAAALDGLKWDYATAPALTRWAKMQSVLDFRRLLDFLFGKYPVDQERVCYQGCSKGAMMGSALGAVDDRVKQFVLRACPADMVLLVRDSGDERFVRTRAQAWYSDDFFRALMAPTDPRYFVGRLSPRPVLFQFGRRDRAVPPSCFKQVVAQARAPKTEMWYDAGHGLREAGAQPMVDARAWVAGQWQRPDLVTEANDNWPKDWDF